jgi:hypothetical protein
MGFPIRINTAAASISEFPRNIFKITQYAQSHIIYHFEASSFTQISRRVGCDAITGSAAGGCQYQVMKLATNTEGVSA